MNYKNILGYFAVLLCAVLLSGCMAVALAPSIGMAAGTVAGTMENSVLVTVDEKTLTPETRAAFATARSLAVVAGDRASIKAADLFETKGGYLVSMDRTTAKNGDITGSERREALRKLCVNPRPDMALIGRVTKSQAGNVIVAAFSGRAKIKED